MIPTAGKPAFTKPPAAPNRAVMEIDGLAGSGKTHLLGTVGKGGKILLIDTEDGAVSYSSDAYLNDPAATEPSNIDVLSLTGVSSAQELVFKATQAIDYVVRSKNVDGYALVALDSLTEFQKKFLSMYEAKDPRQAYGALSDGLYGIVWKARSLPCSIVFTSRPKVAEDAVLNTTVVRSDVAPSVWSVFSGLLDAIGYYSVRVQGMKTERVLDFSLNNRFQSKTRYGLGKMVNPTMQEILEVVSKATKQEAETGNEKKTAPKPAPRPNIPIRK